MISGIVDKVSLGKNIKGNKRLLESLSRDVDCYLSDLGRPSANIIEIGSDKEPVFLRYLALEYPNSNFIHYKDDEVRTRKINPSYRSIENLEVAYSKKDLFERFPPPYDLGMGFFTLHELKNPYRSLKKVNKLLVDNGKFILVEYNLSWLNELAKKEKWNAKDIEKHFKGIFNAGNEKRALKNEDKAIENHTKFGSKDYEIMFKKAGFEGVLNKSYEVETSFGMKPKIFLYIGEKIKN